MRTFPCSILILLAPVLLNLSCQRGLPVLSSPLSGATFGELPARDAVRFRVRDSAHRAALLDTLNVHEELWRRLRPSRYEYAVRLRCFCFADLMVKPYLVRVTAETSEVRDSLGRMVTRDASRAARLSIDSVFAALRDDIRSGAPYVQIRYEPRFGFPEYGLTDYPGLTDSYFEAVVRQFRVH